MNSYPTFQDAYGQGAPDAQPPPLEAKMNTQPLASPWDTLDQGQPNSGTADPNLGMAQYKGK